MNLDIGSNRDKNKKSPKVSGDNSLKLETKSQRNNQLSLHPSPKRQKFQDIQITYPEEEEDRPYESSYVNIHNDIKIEEVRSPAMREEDLYQYIQDEDVESVTHFIEYLESQQAKDKEQLSNSQDTPLQPDITQYINVNGLSPLHLAVTTNNLDIVKILCVYVLSFEEKALKQQSDLSESDIKILKKE